jgi:hypothetical protein
MKKELWFFMSDSIFRLFLSYLRSSPISVFTSFTFLVSSLLAQPTTTEDDDDDEDDIFAI